MEHSKKAIVEKGIGQIEKEQEIQHLKDSRSISSTGRVSSYHDEGWRFESAMLLKNTLFHCISNNYKPVPFGSTQGSITEYFASEH